jgi:hypothetical protein
VLHECHRSRYVPAWSTLAWCCIVYNPLKQMLDECYAVGNHMQFKFRKLVPGHPQEEASFVLILHNSNNTWYEGAPRSTLSWALKLEPFFGIVALLGLLHALSAMSQYPTALGVAIPALHSQMLQLQPRRAMTQSWLHARQRLCWGQRAKVCTVMHVPLSHPPSR